MDLNSGCFFLPRRVFSLPCIFTAVGADFITYLPSNGCTTGGASSEFFSTKYPRVNSLHLILVSLPWEPPQTLSTQNIKVCEAFVADENGRTHGECR